MLRDGPHWLPAWAAASVLLLVLQFVAGLAFPLALAAGLACGAGLTVALRPRALAETVTQGSRADIVRKLLAEAEPLLARLRARAATLRDAGIGARFTNMATTAEAVMRALAADPARIGQGQRLLTYFLPRATQLAEGIALLEAQAQPDPERQRRLIEITTRLDDAFACTRDSLAEPELRALDLEMRLLEDALSEANTGRGAR